MRTAFLLGCTALAAAIFAGSGASAATVNYTINPAQSSLTVTGTMKLGSPAAEPISAYDSGSGPMNITSYTGTIKADRVGSTIQFLSGSSIDANLAPTTVFPNINGQATDFDADGDYSVKAKMPDQTNPIHVADTTTGYLSFFNLIFGATSSALTIAANTFPANSMSFQHSTGSLAYVRFGDVFENVYLFGTQSLIGTPTTNLPAGSASIVEAAGIETITIPVNLSYSFTFPGNPNMPGDFFLNYTLSGTLVASAPVPEPASAATLLALLSTTLRRRRVG
jgi:hypothetical protein